MSTSPQRRNWSSRGTIQDDSLLCTLADTIVAGWPEDIKDVPKAVCPYHNHHDIMTVEDGLILKGEALIIPPLERGENTTSYTQRTHGYHQVANTKQDNASIGPGINEDIRKSGLKHARHVNIITHRNQDSHFTQAQHQNAHGNTWVLISLHLMYLSTQLSLTTTPKCHSSGRYYHHSVMLLKPLHCSRRCSLSMEFPKPSDLTMTHNLPAIYSLSLLRSGTLITQPAP